MERKITLIGAGLVGRGWAIVFARAGFDVCLYDLAEKTLLSAMKEIEQNVQDLMDADLLLATTVTKVMGRIHTETDLDLALKDTIYVQESTFEDLETKKKLLKTLDQGTADNVVIGSSTSALLPSKISEDINGKHRFLVVHPVNPPYLVPLVEIVPSPWTSDDTVQYTHSLMKEIGQMPIGLKHEVSGFVLNRLQVALVNEAISLVNHNVASVEDIDAAVSYGLGLRWSFMGPFETIDLNAHNGVDQYMRQFDNMYQIAKEMEPQAPFSDELVSNISEQRRNILELNQIEERRMWRDRALMSLAKFKHSIQKNSK